MEGITKGDKETIGGDGQVHYLDCGAGYMLLTCVEVDQTVHSKYA